MKNWPGKKVVKLPSLHLEGLCVVLYVIISTICFSSQTKIWWLWIREAASSEIIGNFESLQMLLLNLLQTKRSEMWSRQWLYIFLTSFTRTKQKGRQTTGFRGYVSNEKVLDVKFGTKIWKGGGFLRLRGILLISFFLHKGKGTKGYLKCKSPTCWSPPCLKQNLCRASRNVAGKLPPQSHEPNKVTSN